MLSFLIYIFYWVFILPGELTLSTVQTGLNCFLFVPVLGPLIVFVLNIVLVCVCYKFVWDTSKLVYENKYFPKFLGDAILGLYNAIKNMISICLGNVCAYIWTAIETYVRELLNTISEDFKKKGDYISIK